MDGGTRPREKGREGKFNPSLLRCEIPGGMFSRWL